MIDSDYQREHDVMESLSDEQQDILFDLLFQGERHRYKDLGPQFGMKNFPSGTEHGHSIIDSLIQKNNLMNVLKDPEVLSYMYGGAQDTLFPYSGEPRDAVFSPQTQSFESYDERNPMNLRKGGFR